MCTRQSVTTSGNHNPEAVVSDEVVLWGQETFWGEIISGLSLHNVGGGKALDTFLEGELYRTKKWRITDNS